MITPHHLSRVLKKSARKLFRQFGIDIQRYPNGTASRIFPNPYEALFASDRQIVFTFPTKCCVDKLGFSYTRWHPWAETVKQLRDSPQLPFEESIVKAFYSQWSFPLLNDALVSKMPPGKLRNHFAKIFHGDFLPFSPALNQDLFKAVESASRYLESDNKNAGFPLSIDESLHIDGTWTDVKGNIEMHRLKSLMDAIQRHGYRRNDGADGDICGYLIRRDGQLRFVVTCGLHRASVLAAFNCEQLTVRMLLDMYVDVDSIESWPLVKEGVWTRDKALDYFNHLLDFDSEAWVNRIHPLRSLNQTLP